MLRSAPWAHTWIFIIAAQRQTQYVPEEPSLLKTIRLEAIFLYIYSNSTFHGITLLQSLRGCKNFHPVPHGGDGTNRNWTALTFVLEPWWVRPIYPPLSRNRLEPRGMPRRFVVRYDDNHKRLKTPNAKTPVVLPHKWGKT